MRESRDWISYALTKKPSPVTVLLAALSGAFIGIYIGYLSCLSKSYLVLTWSALTDLITSLLNMVHFYISTRAFLKSTSNGTFFENFKKASAKFLPSSMKSEIWHAKTSQGITVTMEYFIGSLRMVA